MRYQKPHKYKAKRTEVDGISFDSKREAQRWSVLKVRERIGEIRNLDRQVKFPIEVDGKPIRIRSKRYPKGRIVSYFADFAYEERQDIETECEVWSYIIEDVKGHDTPLSRLKRALVEAIYGVEVKVT